MAADNHNIGSSLNTGDRSHTCDHGEIGVAAKQSGHNDGATPDVYRLHLKPLGGKQAAATAAINWLSSSRIVWPATIFIDRGNLRLPNARICSFVTADRKRPISRPHRLPRPSHQCRPHTRRHPQANQRDITIEIEGEERPACVAEVVSLMYPG